jgi:hypothetical protein
MCEGRWGYCVGVGVKVDVSMTIGTPAIPVTSSVSRIATPTIHTFITRLLLSLPIQCSVVRVVYCRLGL